MNITKKFISQKAKNNLTYILFLAVPILIYLAFFVYPNVNTLVFSLYSWDGVGDKVFIGLKNYVDIITKSKPFTIALKNTVLYTITLVVFQNLIGLVLALLLKRANRMNNVLRTVFFMPAILSSVAVSFIWGFIYDPNIGAINTLLGNLGLESLQRIWLGDPSIVIFSIAFVHVWVGAGYSMILFVAGLQQIPNDLYEAAAIDGSNVITTFFRVTLPQLKPVVLTTIVLCTIGSFKAFDYVYLLTNGGGLGGKSDVLATLIYKEAFANSRYGASAALAVILLVVVTIITIVQMYLLRDKE